MRSKTTQVAQSGPMMAEVRFLMDLGLRYRLGSLMISGKVNNILDTLYVTHGEDWGDGWIAYWPGATRSFYASLEYHF